MRLCLRGPSCCETHRLLAEQQVRASEDAAINARLMLRRRESRRAVAEVEAAKVIQKKMSERHDSIQNLKET